MPAEGDRGLVFGNRKLARAGTTVFAVWEQPGQAKTPGPV